MIKDFDSYRVHRMNLIEVSHQLALRLYRHPVYVCASIHIIHIYKYFILYFLFVSRYSNLILNLFSLMVDANIPDIALEPDKTVKKVKLLLC